MKKRTLGNSEIKVAPLAFGGNVIGWTIDEATTFKLLDAFVAAGFNLIDTADVYSRWAPGHTGGESETIIGKWLMKRDHREKVVIATKVGMDMGNGNKGLSKAHILRSVEGSLKRLQTDYIDLYQAHTDDADTQLEDTLDAFAQLVKQGKARVIGASNYTAERLFQALDVSAKLGVPAYQTLQPRYNLYDREGYEEDLEALCRERGLGVITYSSLASGFLTGKYRSKDDASKSARGNGVVNKYLNDRGLRILKALDEVADKLKSTPASVALAWLIARPGITAPIASATSVEQLESLVKAVQLELDRASIEHLNQASAWTSVAAE